MRDRRIRSLRTTNKGNQVGTAGESGTIFTARPALLLPHAEGMDSSSVLLFGPTESTNDNVPLTEHTRRPHGARPPPQPQQQSQSLQHFLLATGRQRRIHQLFFV
jgi:hypothetical protein